MTLKDNKALIRRAYKLLDRKDWAAMKPLSSPKIVDHNPLQGQKPGQEGFIESRRSLMKGVSDYRTTIDSMIAEGDKVAVCVTHTFTHTGRFFDIPPTNRKVSYTEMTVWRIVKGKITDRWCTSDSLGMLTQIGATLTFPKK